MIKKLVAIVLALFAAAAFAASVDVNKASQADLDAVKGIGETKAKAIVDYRTKNGPYKSVDDLRGVKGFGEKTLAKLKSELTVDGASSTPRPPAGKAPTAPAKQLSK